MKLAFLVLVVAIVIYQINARPTATNEENFIGNDPMLSKYLFEGDIMLPDAANGDITKAKSYLYTGTNKWSEGRVIYTLDSEYTDEQLSVIRQGMNQIETQTAYQGKSCITFVQRDASKHADLPYVAIKNLDGCWSYLGRITSSSSQNLSLLAPATSTSAHCIYKGIVMHELLHALGFQHEQTREDRDNYVTINYSNMDSSVAHNFNKAYLTQNSYLSTSYDYYSIMHYDSYAFSNNGQPTIVPKDSSVTLVGSAKKDSITASDVDGIRRAYGCAGSPEPNGSDNRKSLPYLILIVFSLISSIIFHTITFS